MPMATIGLAGTCVGQVWAHGMGGCMGQCGGARTHPTIQFSQNGSDLQLSNAPLA